VKHKYKTIKIGKSMVCPGKSHLVAMRIMNAGNKAVKIYKDSHVADLESIMGRKEPKQVNAIEERIKYIPPEVGWDEKMPERQKRMEKEPSKRLKWEGTALSKEGKEKLKNIVDKYPEAFVGEDGKIGKYNGPIVHRIDLTPGAIPFRQRAYRYSPAMKKEVEKQVENMLKQQLIKESESEWCSPIVMVQKPDGSFRFAVDYRRLNSVTQKRVYQLPLIQELLDLMGGKKFYTSLDLMAGFHQVPMKEEDTPKTAFICHLGIFEFLVMPYALWIVCRPPNISVSDGVPEAATLISDDGVYGRHCVGEFD
jgi:hypothetical protein